MTVAELFVNIGIKGSDKVTSVLVGTKKQLTEVGSEGLAAKAAIVGIVYALEQLMHRSMMSGAAIENFNALTNISSKTLQQWEYGFRIAGASADEAGSNIKSLQAAMGKMALNKGVPEGMVLMGQAVGGLDFNRMKTDIVYLLEKGREFAKMTKGTPNIAAYNEVLRGIGFTDQMIAAARRGLLDQSVLTKAPIYNSKALDSVNQEWQRFDVTLNKIFADLTAKHGLEIINDIRLITIEVGHLIDAFTTLAEKLQIFKGIRFVSQGWTELMKLGTEATDLAAKGPSKSGKKGDLDYLLHKMFAPSSEEWADMQKGAWRPPMALPSGGAGTGAGTTVNQTNNIYGVPKAEDAVEAMNRGAARAVSQGNRSQQK